MESNIARRSHDDAAYVRLGRALDVELTRDEHRARLEEDRAQRAHARQLDKLERMAALDRQIAADEHAQALALRTSLAGLGEREMLAAQASELARTEWGAAFAAALSGDEARRADQAHAVETRALLEAQLERLERLAAVSIEASARRDGGAVDAYGRAMDAMSRVAASRAAPAPPTPIAVAAAGPTVPCKNTECSSVLAPGARFCGACGASQ
ncbi:MAG: zinc ribbon domain-containing protein [Polyangiaceae bacterium]